MSKSYEEIAQSIIDSLSTPILDDYRKPQLLGAFFEESEYVNSLSSSEAIMLDLALSLYSGQRTKYGVSLALAYLDNDRFARYILALLDAKPGAIMIVSTKCAEATPMTTEHYRYWYVECEDWSIGPLPSRERAERERIVADNSPCGKKHAVIELLTSTKLPIQIKGWSKNEDSSI